VGGPQKQLGTALRLQNALVHENSRKQGEWVMDISRREHYHKLLCIISSQEDGCPKVRETYGNE